VIKQRLANVLQKEWRVLASTPSNILFVTLIPLLITGQALLIIWFLSRFVGGQALEATMIQNALENAAPPLADVANLPTAQRFVVFLLSQFNFFLLLIPVMIAIAHSAGVSPLPPAFGATLGASFGFMLPVSTPPNAIVYSSGRIPITKMITSYKGI